MGGDHWKKMITNWHMKQQISDDVDPRERSRDEEGDMEEEEDENEE